MKPFIYTANPGRVLFGKDAGPTIAEEAARLGCTRLLLLSTPAQESAARALAGPGIAAVFAGAAMHTPTSVTDTAMRVVADTRADGLLAIGGGSTIGLAKAIALRTDLPQIVVPTTYAGSEMTAILGETANGIKTTRSDPRILPEIVIYDVALTTTLPVEVSVASGFNAIAHAVEALYARDRNPIVSLMAREGITAIVRALPRIVASPGDAAGRTDALYGAWLSGTCLASVGMALHHKLCHTLGGTFGLPHAQTHTVILPHALAYNQGHCGDALEGLTASLGSDPAAALHALARDLDAPVSLKELGMPRDGIDEAVRLALANPYWNPRPIEERAIRRLLIGAWEGRAPGDEGE